MMFILLLIGNNNNNINSYNLERQQAQEQLIQAQNRLAQEAIQTRENQRRIRREGVITEQERQRSVEEINREQADALLLDQRAQFTLLIQQAEQAGNEALAQELRLRRAQL